MSRKPVEGWRSLTVSGKARADLIRRLERHGRTRCIEDSPLITSSRRFAGHRPVAIVLGRLEVHALYHLGVPPALLPKRYESQRLRAHEPDSLLRGVDG